MSERDLGLLIAVLTLIAVSLQIGIVLLDPATIQAVLTIISLIAGTIA